MSKNNVLLTYVPQLLYMKSLRMSYNEIRKLLKNETGNDFTVNQLINIIQYIKKDNINKKYNYFAIMDISCFSLPGFDDRILEVSVTTHGLIVILKQALRFFKISHLLLDKTNFTKKITTDEGLLYAKRLLKQYHLDDKDLLNKFYESHIKTIDYEATINILHNNLSSEVSEWAETLKFKTSTFSVRK